MLHGTGSARGAAAVSSRVFRASELDRAQRSRRVAGLPSERCMPCGVDEDERVPLSGKNVREFVRVQLRVDRHGGEPRPPAREQRLDVFRSVAGHDRDAFTGMHFHRLQRARERRRAPRERLVVAQDAITRREGRQPRPAARRTGERRCEIAGGSRCVHAGTSGGSGAVSRRVRPCRRNAWCRHAKAAESTFRDTRPWPCSRPRSRRRSPCAPHPDRRIR